MGLCKNKMDAEVFTLVAASRIIKLANDARIIWGITTTKELTDGNKILPPLYDPEVEKRETAKKKRHRTQKQRRRKRG